jgi:hypothetical protein
MSRYYCGHPEALVVVVVAAAVEALHADQYFGYGADEAGRLA